MGLASPKVEAVSVASGSCRCAQGSREVVNLGVRAGRLGVVLEEAVDDSAGCPASKRPSQRGGCVVAADHVLVSGHRSSQFALDLIDGLVAGGQEAHSTGARDRSGQGGR
jgi:hypothetical protein